MDSGRLEDEPVPVLCRRLAIESRTGCLYLRSDSGESEEDVRVYLRDGRIYTAAADRGRQHLGRRLIAGGHLTQDDLDHALLIHQREVSSVRLGDVLVAQGMVDREVLREAIREQVSDTVAVALSRTTGQWQFNDGEAVPEDVPLGLTMRDTLMEAARRVPELETLRDRLGSLDVVVDFGSGGRAIRLSLRADEWVLLTHIDGHSSVAQIADRSGSAELRVAQVIYGLLSAGVVTIVEEPPTSPPDSGAHDAVQPINAGPDTPHSPSVADADSNDIPSPDSHVRMPAHEGSIGRLRSSERASSDRSRSEEGPNT